MHVEDRTAFPPVVIILLGVVLTARAAQLEPLFDELPAVGEPCTCVLTVEDERDPDGVARTIGNASRSEAMDCSGRGLQTLSASQMVTPICGAPTALNISHNSFLKFPDGFSSAATVDGSYNRIEHLPHIQQLHPAVETLDLSWNRIYVTHEELKRLDSLRILRLGHNELRTLSFLPQPCALRHLDVAFNDVEQFESPLRECATLEHLDLSYNRIKTLPVDAFSAMHGLRALDLSRNTLAPLPEGVFAPLENLEELYLNDTHLENVTGDMFASLLRLRHLSIARNSLVLAGLSAHAFESLGALTHLNLAHNDLRVLPTETLAPVAPHLEELDASGCGLTALPENAFTAFVRLRRLALSHNALRALPANSLPNEGLPVLTALLLRGNLLEELPEDTATRLPALVSLDLSFNAWPTLPLLALAQAPALRVVHFAGSGLKFIANADTLRGAGSHVRSLGLHDNGLRNLSVDAFVAWPQLLWLRLDRNALSSLPSEIFSPLTQLQRLDLSRNALTELPGTVLRSTPLLQRLSLARNRLRFLPAALFQGLSRLERLDLSGNRLRALPDRLCLPLHSLKELDVSYNSLVALPSESVASGGCPSAPQLRWTSLEHNDIAAPDVSSLRAWLRSPAQTQTDQGETPLRKRLSLEGNPLRASTLVWLLSETQLFLWTEPERCGCGVARNGSAAVRFCVETAARAAAADDPGEAGCDWREAAVRASARTTLALPPGGRPRRPGGRRHHRHIRSHA